MSRLIWIGVGAAGGIFAYRRGQQAWEEAKIRGMAGSAAAVAQSASHLLNQVRSTLADADAPAALPTAAAVPYVRIEGGQRVITLPVEVVHEAGIRIEGLPEDESEDTSQARRRRRGERGAVRRLPLSRQRFSA